MVTELRARSHRAIKVLLTAFLVLGGLLGLSWVVFSWVASAQLKGTQDCLERSGHLVSARALVPPAIPEEENAASTYEEVFAIFDGGSIRDEWEILGTWNWYRGKGRGMADLRPRDRELVVRHFESPGGGRESRNQQSLRTHQSDDPGNLTVVDREQEGEQASQVVPSFR